MPRPSRSASNARNSAMNPRRTSGSVESKLLSPRNQRSWLLACPIGTGVPQGPSHERFRALLALLWRQSEVARVVLSAQLRLPLTPAPEILPIPFRSPFCSHLTFNLSKSASDIGRHGTERPRRAFLRRWPPEHSLVSLHLRSALAALPAIQPILRSLPHSRPRAQPKPSCPLLRRSRL